MIPAIPPPSFGLRAGFMACLPLAISIMIFGLVYGLLAAGKGFSVAETVLMSLIVFAGSSQLLALCFLAGSLS